MKLGVFADPHYSSAELTCGRRYNSRSLEKIERALAHFAAEGCDLIVCLGDLIDREETHAREIENLRHVGELFDACPIDIIAMRGNHDGFAFHEKEFYEVLGERCRPRSLCIEGKHLFFADACYFEDGRPYQPGEGDWTDTFFPAVDILKTFLHDTRGVVYVFMHQNIDPSVPENHRLRNDAEVRRLLEESGRVATVFQGHYHHGAETVENGIHYLTLPAMCECEDGYHVIEI